LDDLRRERAMSMVLITHDLGVVRGRADDVMVMYGGRTMESADTSTLFGRMDHPYTRALLETIPRIDAPAHSRLVPIPGRPPSPAEVGRSCPFAARCGHRIDDCLAGVPPMVDLGGGHRSACVLSSTGSPAAGSSAAGRSPGPGGDA